MLSFTLYNNYYSIIDLKRKQFYFGACTMKTVGIIKSVDNDISEIEVFGDGSGCASCSTGSCASCSAAQNGRTYRAVNKHRFTLEKGKLVEVELPAGQAVSALLRVIVFPIILFFTFYSVVDILWSVSEGLKIAGGFLGLLMGFGLNFFVTGKMKKKEMPVITKIF